MNVLAPSRSRKILKSRKRERNKNFPLHSNKFIFFMSEYASSPCLFSSSCVVLLAFCFYSFCALFCEYLSLDAYLEIYCFHIYTLFYCIPWVDFFFCGKKGKQEKSSNAGFSGFLEIQSEVRVWQHFVGKFKSKTFFRNFSTTWHKNCKIYFDLY